MKLRRIQLENYRNIAALDLRVDDLQVIFGRNNVGKSNVLEALREYRQFAKEVERDGSWYEERVRDNDTEKSIRFCLDFEPSDREREWLLERVLGSSSSSSDAVSELFDLGWGDQVRHEFVIDEVGTRRSTLSVLCEGDWIAVCTAYAERTRGYELLTANFDTYPDVEVERDKDRMGNLHPSAVLRKYFDSVFEHTVDQWRWVSPFRQPEVSVPVQEDYDLQSESRNLPTVLLTLANNRPKTFDRIVDAYTDIMEGVTDVITPVRGTDGSPVATIEVVEGDARFDLSEISAGSKQILSLLTEIETAGENTQLLLLEEPETHLHPGAQRTVYTAIRELVEKSTTQSIVTTHSDIFVDESDSSQLVKAVRDRSGAKFREIEPDEVTDELQDLGYSKSSLLQSRAVVFVEGRSDELVIKEFTRTLGFPLADNGVHVIDLEGEGNMLSDGQSLVKLLSAFETPFLFVLDSHGNSPREQQNELLGEINAPRGDWNVTPNDVFVWEAYGIESYLVQSPGAVAEVLDVGRGTVEEMLEENADVEDAAEVLNEVFTEVLDRDYQKDADGVLIARKIAERDVPTEVERAVDKIQSLV